MQEREISPLRNGDIVEEIFPGIHFFGLVYRIHGMGMNIVRKPLDDGRTWRKDKVLYGRVYSLLIIPKALRTRYTRFSGAAHERQQLGHRPLERSMKQSSESEASCITRVSRLID